MIIVSDSSANSEFLVQTQDHSGINFTSRYCIIRQIESLLPNKDANE